MALLNFATWKDELSQQKVLAEMGVGKDGLRWVSDVPEYGTGIYQYSERADCGVHQIQVSSKGDIIYVHGVNTSHGKDYQFAYIWKKEAAEFSG